MATGHDRRANWIPTGTARPDNTDFVRSTFIAVWTCRHTGTREIKYAATAAATAGLGARADGARIRVAVDVIPTRLRGAVWFRLLALVRAGTAFRLVAAIGVTLVAAAAGLAIPTAVIGALTTGTADLAAFAAPAIAQRAAVWTVAILVATLVEAREDVLLSLDGFITAVRDRRVEPFDHVAQR